MQRRHLSGGGLAAAGLLIAVIQVFHGLRQSTRPLVLLFETVPFVLVALTLSYAGYWLASNEQFDADVGRVLAWGGGGVVLFVSVGALQLFSQRVFLGTLDRASYVAIDFVTVGAVVGILVGIYDARSRQTLRELERERDRIEAFGNKAADVNNYGRAVNQCGSVDEVSALCIQAMQALLGVSEVAVLALSEETAVIDDTILNVSEETLRSLGDRAGDGERATVVTHGDVPASLVDRTNAVVSVEITTVGETSFVLVALAGSDARFEEEDVQLLELLTAHAGTAIDGIYARQDSGAGDVGQTQRANPE
jgi:GAF domain-containing protein